MKRIFLAGALAIGMALSSEADAQGGGPVGYATTDASGAIVAANTYQTVQAQNIYRHGCTIQNTSANAETVRVNATIYNLAAGATFNCQVSGVVVTDTISIASPTAGSIFSAGFQ